MLVPILMEDLPPQDDDAIFIRDMKIKRGSSLTRIFNLEDDGSINTGSHCLLS